MKKLLLTVITASLIFSLCACGGSKNNDDDSSSESEKKPTVSVSVAKAPEVIPEPTKPEPETVAAGNTITVDFAEITITEAAVADNIQTSIKTGNITYTTGPDAKADSEYIYLRGTIKNTGTTSISSPEIEGNVIIDGYTYKAQNLSIIESNGDSTYTLDPLMQYTYTFYAEVPNELALNHESCKVEFGFNDLFAQTSDEVETRPYYYALTIK